MRKIIKKHFIPHEENEFRPHLLRLAGVLVFLALIVGLFFMSQAHRLVLTASDFLASVLPSVLVDLANADRASNHVASLSVNPLLEAAARMKAEDMAAKGYFAHTSPDGVTPWSWFSKANYRFAYAGENLAIDFDDSSAVNTAWMNSSSHRANILNGNFTEIGIATARGVYNGRETLFVVQMFGRPLAKPESAAVVAATSPVSGAKEDDIAGEEVAGTEIAVIPISNEASDLENQTFVAVENAERLASPVSDESPETSAPKYASSLERLVTSPTRTLAIAYLIISIVLFMSLVGVLLVQHDRKVRHVLLIVLLFILLCGLFYAYRAFVYSEVSILSAVSDYCLG